MLWNNKNCCIKDWICLFHKTLLSFFERLELREERSGTIPLIKKLFLILFGNSQKKLKKMKKIPENSIIKKTSLQTSLRKSRKNIY